MMRPMKGVLVSWLGRTDLRAVTDSDQVGVGPIAQALRTGGFSRLELLCDCPADEADTYREWLRPQIEARVVLHLVTLPSPTDFDAIYRNARAIAAQAMADAGGQAERLTFHLSPGTPAMAAVWIILAKTGCPAELIESSIQHGVRRVSVPFQISADFIPDLLRRPDAELTRLTAQPSARRPGLRCHHPPEPGDGARGRTCPAGRAPLDPRPDRG